MTKHWVGKSRSDRGAGALEYLGIVVVAALLIGALIAAIGQSRIGDQIACQLRSIVDSADRDCSTEVDPLYYDANGSGNDDFLTGPADRNSSGSSNSTTAEGGQQPEYFQNASNTDDPVDEEKVENAVNDFEVNGGLWQRIFGGDGLRDVEKAVRGLNGPEIDAYFAGLSDGEIADWIETMESNWTEGEQRAVLQYIAAHASVATLDKLSEYTSLLQPVFDDIELPEDKQRKAAKLEDIDTWHWSEVDHELFSGGVRPADVAQGGLGDCWYMASLMSTAHRQPKIITDAITVNPNGTYEVRLFEGGEEVFYTVDPRMVVDGEGREVFHNSRSRTFVDENGDVVHGVELWPAVMEKALAMHEGTYGKAEGGQAARGLEMITGVDSVKYDTARKPPSLTELEQMHESGSMISFSSLNKGGAKKNTYESDDGETFYYNHAYVLEGVDVEAGTVTLWNPWGTRKGKLTVSADEYAELFKRVDVNEGWN